MKSKLLLIKGCFVDAIAVALRSAAWLMRFMIPVTFVVSMLDYAGVVEVMSKYIEPVFAYAGLDARGVLVFLTAVFASIYSAIAVMATLAIDYRMAIILAVMSLIAHNLIVECTIQKKTGYSYLGVLFLRLGMAFLAGVVINNILPENLTGNLFLNVRQEEILTIGEALKEWGLSIVNLAVKITLFIYILNVLQNILKAFNILDMLIRPFRIVMRIMGLPYPVTFLWLVANSLGLAYGGAVMIEGARSGEVSPEEMKLLNTSIAITHSLVEDTILFFVIGIPLFWLVIPRLLLSIVAVWVQRGFISYKAKSLAHNLAK